jgi:hypothetical protein
MPGGDRTGPMGMGPMTGRAAGYCASYPIPGYMNPYGGRLGLGFGWGRGRGRGFGWRRIGFPYGAMAYAPNGGALPYADPYALYDTEEKEIEVLQSQSKLLQDELSAINKRISEIEAKEKKKDK